MVSCGWSRCIGVTGLAECKCVTLDSTLCLLRFQDTPFDQVCLGFSNILPSISESVTHAETDLLQPRLLFRDCPKRHDADDQQREHIQAEQNEGQKRTLRQEVTPVDGATLTRRTTRCAASSVTCRAPTHIANRPKSHEETIKIRRIRSVDG